MSASDSADDLLADWLNRRDGVPEDEPLPPGPVRYWSADEPRPLTARRLQRAAALGRYWAGAWNEALELAEDVPEDVWFDAADGWTTRIEAGLCPEDGISFIRSRPDPGARR